MDSEAEADLGHRRSAFQTQEGAVQNETGDTRTQQGELLLCRLLLLNAEYHRELWDIYLIFYSKHFAWLYRVLEGVLWLYAKWEWWAWHRHRQVGLWSFQWRPTTQRYSFSASASHRFCHWRQNGRLKLFLCVHVQLWSSWWQQQKQGGGWPSSLLGMNNWNVTWSRFTAFCAQRGLPSVSFQQQSQFCCFKFFLLTLTCLLIFHRPTYHHHPLQRNCTNF